MATAEDKLFERARLSRDARFDGRFFVAVKTTGIYCRPVCPAKPPKAENVEFFRTAAAASEAGFRPCLRCRPETAPGSPAWVGSSTTVRRGLRLIAHGALDDGNVDELAERLGVTARHLRRLFDRDIGASPLAIAQTQRLHFAKRLVDETSLSMTDVALAAGFGSVRRFNDTFRRAYGRSPRSLRGNARPAKAGEGASLTVRIPVREPYSWDSALAFFRARAIPGVEAVVDGHYRRSIRFGRGPSARHGAIDVSLASSPGQLDVRLIGAEAGDVFAASQRVRDLLDADAPIHDIATVLGQDAALASRLRSLPGPRVMGAWDGFELLVRAILGQQVSVAAATTLSGRVASRYGEQLDPVIAREVPGLDYVFPTADKLSRVHMNNMGIVGSRIQSIRALAREVARGRLQLDSSASPDDVYAALTAIRGIGDWTAQYVLMRVVRVPDAFPASDLGLLKALEPGQRLKPKVLAERSERWRPWRAYAAALLWYAIPNSGG